MSDLVNSGANAIGKAEEDIRALLGRAALIGDYDSVLVLTAWARGLRGLLDASEKKTFQPVEFEDSGGALSPGHATGHAAAAGSRAKANRRKRRTRRTTKPPSRQREYPKFLREGDSLLKIGWSKSSKAPYEHRASRQVLALVAGALKRAGRDGRRFTMEEILPVVNPDDGTEIPSYQVYLCVAWLRGAGLIVQHGRQGYSLPADLDLTGESDRRMSDLPRR